MTFAATTVAIHRATAFNAPRRTLRTVLGVAGAAAALALLAAAGAALSSPQVSPTVHELPRVVVTGKVVRDAQPAVAQLPRVVVTGSVVRDSATHVVQLPRVVVTGHKTAAHTLMAQAGRIAADGA